MTFVPTNRLNTTESVTLDIVRIAAAVVVYGHFTQSVFTTGFANRTGTAVACVAVFFVLSGFVVRHVTRRRASTPGGYLADRAPRIYSVALPALLIMWLLDTVARHANPRFLCGVSSSSTRVVSVGAKRGLRRAALEPGCCAVLEQSLLVHQR